MAEGIQMETLKLLPTYGTYSGDRKKTVVISYL